ncbi:MAG: DMT family transporter [Cohaesibacter sp.]|nr:DMT family transporter [Cohaesibacter sp.]
MIHDKPLLGISLMIAFCALIPFGDALVKLMSESVPIMMVLLFRFGMQGFLLWPIILIKNKGSLRISFSHSRRLYHLLAIRTLLHGTGIVGMYYGLKYMPLADTVAIAFIFPLLMLLVGHFYMGEYVGPHRFGAALLGFVGTLMVVQPNFIEVGLNVLWPIFVAVTFVIFMLVTRKMSQEMDAFSIQSLSGLMGLAGLIIMMIMLNGQGWEGFDWTMPQGVQWLYLLGSGIIGTFAHLLFTAALRYAPSTTLAPMQYLEMPFATLIGWIIFSDLPNWLAAVGIAITIGAGLYIIYREQQTHSTKSA